MSNRLLPCLTLVVATFFAASPVASQVTFGSSDILGLIGSSVDSAVDTTGSATVDVGAPGEDETWDLSGTVISGDVINQFFHSPAATPYAAEFPSANFAITTTSESFEGITLYSYSEVTASLIRDLGAVVDYEDSTVVEISLDSGIALPVQYDDMWTNVERDTTEGPGFVLISIDSTRTHVDGWGTVVVTAGSFDALRFRNDELYVSNTYVNDVLFASDTTRTIRYEWIAQEVLVAAAVTSQFGETDPDFTDASDVQMATAVTVVSVDDPGLPQDGRLVAGAYPNPFSERVTVDVATASPHVDAAVFDLLGRRVRTLDTPAVVDGSLTLQWDGHSDDGTRATNGVYFLRIDDGTRTEARKVILVR